MVLFSLLPGDCYSDFHPISWRFLLRYFHYYPAIVTLLISRLQHITNGLNRHTFFF